MWSCWDLDLVVFRNTFFILIHFENLPFLVDRLIFNISVALICSTKAFGYNQIPHEGLVLHRLSCSLFSYSPAYRSVPGQQLPSSALFDWLLLDAKPVLTVFLHGLLLSAISSMLSYFQNPCSIPYGSQIISIRHVLWAAWHRYARCWSSTAWWLALLQEQWTPVSGPSWSQRIILYRELKYILACRQHLFVFASDSFCCLNSLELFWSQLFLFLVCQWYSFELVICFLHRICSFLPLPLLSLLVTASPSSGSPRTSRPWSAPCGLHRPAWSFHRSSLPQPAVPPLWCCTWESAFEMCSSVSISLLTSPQDPSGRTCISNLISFHSMRTLGYPVGYFLLFCL